jgi:hypothetical protein
MNTSDEISWWDTARLSRTSDDWLSPTLEQLRESETRRTGACDLLSAVEPLGLC